MKNETAFKHELSWEEKAKSNPLYAVMAVEEFEEQSPDTGSWTAGEMETFFAKGRLLYDRYLAPVLKLYGLEPSRAFLIEYGSGMGRILKAVQSEGFRCGGIDISPSMLDYSRKLVPEITDLSALDKNGKSTFPDETADFVYSYAVLQHIPDLSGVRRAVSEMARLLKPGGILRLQFRTFDSPLHRPKKRKRVFNFEKRSLVLSRGKFQIMKHTHWLGVPLATRGLQKILYENGVQLMSMDKHLSQKGDFIWITGAKR